MRPSSDLTCNGTGISYDPIQCVSNNPGWKTGSMRCHSANDSCLFWYANRDSAGALIYSTFGEDTKTNILKNYFSSADFYSPDVVFISPYFGNCKVLDQIHLIHLAAKILYVPIFPIIPPPFEYDPGEYDPERPWESQV